MNTSSHDPYLERIKAEIRADADAARARTPVARGGPPEPASASGVDGVERQRLDYSISDLTGADYGAFIDHVFRAVLKRNPDEVGATQQLHLLVSGAAKAEVIGNLRWSGEGRRIGVRVRGLLPRYVFAKLGRIPLLGYCINWLGVLAGLPILIRHQRAMDAVNAARFSDLEALQRDCRARFEKSEAAHAALLAESEQRHHAALQEIQRLQMLIDAQEQRIDAQEQRSQTAASRSELDQLRHYVHATNHWLTTLQKSLAELDDASAQAQARCDTLAAAIAESADARAQRTQRHRDWSIALATRLGAGTRLFDLGSGDGTWVRTLAAQGVTVDGVEANAQLVAQAQQQRVPVTLGAPIDALARCSDASLDALTVCAGLFDSSQAVARLLDEARRALRPGGTLLMRVEAEPYRPAQRVSDPHTCAALLAAAGFAAPQVLTGIGGSAVLAQRP